MFDTWTLAVLTLITSSAAISWLVQPRATRVSTSASRGERPRVSTNWCSRSADQSSAGVMSSRRARRAVSPRAAAASPQCEWRRRALSVAARSPPCGMRPRRRAFRLGASGNRWPAAVARADPTWLPPPPSCPAVIRHMHARTPLRRAPASRPRLGVIGEAVSVAWRPRKRALARSRLFAERAGVVAGARPAPPAPPVRAAPWRRTRRGAGKHGRGATLRRRVASSRGQHQPSGVARAPARRGRCRTMPRPAVSGDGERRWRRGAPRRRRTHRARLRGRHEA